MAKTKRKKPENLKTRKPDSLTGTVVQIIGPVVDVEFTSGNLPDIYDALEIKLPTDPQTHKPTSLRAKNSRGLFIFRKFPGKKLMTPQNFLKSGIN